MEDFEPLTIVARANGVGIDRDVVILADALADFTAAPRFRHYRSISPLALLSAARDAETILFLERVTARWLRRAHRFLLIPNQERFPERLVPLLRRVDHILCKSEHAREIFSRYHRSVHYVGFTSLDRRIAGARPDYARFFHLAGGSGLKGTRELLALWSRRPDWPELTVVQHSRNAPDSVPHNVRLVRDYLSDDALRRLQNSSGIHLCPSLSEGWGHYIVEAMSCSALTVTTDGPPMNELVRPDRGVLLPVTRTEPRKLGINHFFDPAAMEAIVDRLIATPEAVKREIGGAGREWFEENDRSFRLRLREVLARLGHSA